MSGIVVGRYVWQQLQALVLTRARVSTRANWRESVLGCLNLNRLRFMNSSVSDFNGRLVTRKCLFVSNSVIGDRFFTPRCLFVSNNSVIDGRFFTPI